MHLKSSFWLNLALFALIFGAFGISDTTYADELPPVPGTERPKAYTLEKTNWYGEHVITIYELNDSTKQYEPKYYNVNLATNSYGEGANTVYLKWEKASDGSTSLVETDSANAQITAKYDNNLGFIASPNGPSDINGKGDFVGNNADPNNYTHGGAISDPYGDIEANFVNNTSSTYGGAISSYWGNMGDIKGNFINNKTGFLGGAIHNARTSVIKSITGDFVGNNVQAQYRSEGGAIWNTIDSATFTPINGYKIETLNSNFINNFVFSNNPDEYAEALGGAIVNYGSTGMSMEDMSEITYYSKIHEINGDFIGNYAKATSDNHSALAYGGAVYNREYGVIDNINGDFIGNYVSSNSGNSHSQSLGGAVYNGSASTIDSIVGNFSNNSAQTISDMYASNDDTNASPTIIVTARGGAVYNQGTINSIKGDFSNNTVSTKLTNRDFYPYYGIQAVDAMGGAIFNDGTIESIESNFFNNSVSYYMAHQTGEMGFGGALANFVNGKISNIKGSFAANSAQRYAGAIFNLGDIESIEANFYGNTAQYGGAIVNQKDLYYYSDTLNGVGHIGSIKGNFTNNIATGFSSANGGAIYNSGTIDYIEGVFENNSAAAEHYSSQGGAINGGNFGTINADFKGNGAYLSNQDMGYPSVTVYGGAISSVSKLDKLNGNFAENYARADGYSSAEAKGGAIYASDIGELSGDFTNNYVEAYTKDGDGYLSYGKSNAHGGAIHSSSALNIMNSSFIGNYAKAESVSGTADARGGAIFSQANVNITADNHNSIFSGNRTITNEKGVRDEKANAIYMAKDFTYSSTDTPLELNLNTVNNGTITFDDQIAGGGMYQEWGMEGPEYKFDESSKYYYNLNINGDSTGKVTLNNDIINANVTLNGTNLKIGREDIFDQSVSLTINDGSSVDMQNGKTGTMNVPNVTVNGNINVKVDADLSGSGSIDGFGSNLNGSGAVTIDSINIVKDMDDGVYATVIDFINNGNISTNLNIPDGSIMTSLYTYYLGLTDDQKIIFEKTGDLGGFASAVANRPAVTDYYITVDKEVVDGYSVISGNQMQGNELNIHGNGNALDGNGNLGISVGKDKILNIEGVGNLLITETDGSNPDAFQAYDKEGNLKYYTTEGSTGWQNFNGNYGAAVSIEDKAVVNISNTVFMDNYTEGFGGAVYVGGSADMWMDPVGGRLEILSGTFINNSAESGGAIYNSGTIENINADFINNKAVNRQGSGISNHASGGAIRNFNVIGNITGNFLNNSAVASASAEGGAIQMWDGSIGDVTANFIGNYVKGSLARGGAVSNEMGSFGTKDENGNIIGGIINSNFINNYAETTNEFDGSMAQGGAIYTKKDLNIIADNGSSLFSGNKTIDNGLETPNAIYVDSNTATLTLKSVNKGVIQIDDQIDGAGGYSVNISGDDTSRVILNNEVKNANVTMDTVNLNLGVNNVFESSDVTVNSGTLSLINGKAEQQYMGSLNIAGNMNLAADVDLVNEKMDTLPDGTTVSNDAKISVNYLNLLNDSTKDKTVIQFAPEDYANSIQYTGDNPIAYSKIFKYDVSYNPDEGFFTFIKGSAGNNPNNYNPSVLAPPVATQAGAYSTQLQTFNYAFQHSDTFMNIPYLDRMAIKERNKYALSPTGIQGDIGVFSPLFTKDEAAGFWFKPYASFESIPLKNGPKVSNINYGTLVGYDSALKPVKHGFDRVITGYIGYNGASQRYSGVDAYQNGGVLGTTFTFYKGNFFNATTASVGASAGDATGMYGSENYTMLLAGLANKTGYNFEFFNGKMILQPSMMISYSFVNTFDYNNAAGLRIKSDPLNAIQLSPGIKLIGNTKNGWQPYIGVSMVWNLLDSTKVTADDVRLPEMSIRPYVQYGVGVQKRFGERMTGYTQAMINNGGRNGVSLSAGFRWSVGKK